jgi:hypothetical protein
MYTRRAGTEFTPPQPQGRDRITDLSLATLPSRAAGGPMQWFPA